MPKQAFANGLPVIIDAFHETLGTIALNDKTPWWNEPQRITAECTLTGEYRSLSQPPPADHLTCCGETTFFELITACAFKYFAQDV